MQKLNNEYINFRIIYNEVFVNLGLSKCMLKVKYHCKLPTLLQNLLVKQFPWYSQLLHRLHLVKE